MVLQSCVWNKVIRREYCIVCLFALLSSLFFPTYYYGKDHLYLQKSVPKEVTLGCATVLNYFCFAFFALLQVVWENQNRTVTCGSQHDQHYLDFKNLH